MFNQVLAIFLIGLFEQGVYTAYLLSINKKEAVVSSVLNFIYLLIYLFIISYAIKDSNTVPLLIAYTLACGIGNYLVMAWEKRRISKEKKNA